jgi:hypothetical protein
MNQVGNQGPRRITRGDVEAVFHAFGNGGRAVLAHSQTAEGAPADVTGSHGSIRPFAGSPWDGAHFCATDWHVILVADFEGGDSSFKHQDAERIMQELQVSFTLDGAPLPTTRTSVKRFLNPPAQFNMREAYYFQQGRLMPPNELSVGSHTLNVEFADATGPSFQDGITFFIDGEGTGACA